MKSEENSTSPSFKFYGVAEIDDARIAGLATGNEK